MKLPSVQARKKFELRDIKSLTAELFCLQPIKWRR